MSGVPNGGSGLSVETVDAQLSENGAAMGAADWKFKAFSHDLVPSCNPTQGFPCGCCQTMSCAPVGVAFEAKAHGKSSYGDPSMPCTAGAMEDHAYG